MVAADALDATVQQYVARAADGRARKRSRARRRSSRRSPGARPADVRALTSRAIAEQRVSPEGQEGLRAFLEKRKPSWTS